MKSKMFRLMALVLCLLTVGAEMQAQQRKKVGLVLGGGGAKGAAEVGVMKVLEEADIPVDYIVGTSIGSIVGALYSIGYGVSDIDSLFRTQDWSFLLSDQVKREDQTFLSKEIRQTYQVRLPFSANSKSTAPTGFVEGQNITNLFSKLTTGYHNVDSFSNLPIPFACVAVNIVDGTEVILNSGSLPLAMRSSMSIPGVFSPVEKDGMLLIDGGALNNFPVDVVKDMGADIIIGIDLSTGWKSREELKSLGSIINQIIDIMGKDKYKANRQAVDLYINPQLTEFNAASFQSEAIDTMLVRGERAARAKWDEIVALREKIYEGVPAESIEPWRRHLASAPDEFDIENIELRGLRTADEDWVRKKLGLKEHTRMRAEDIEKAISSLRGLGIFSRVEYQLTDNAPYNLIFMIEEEDYRYINVGIRLDSEEVGSVLLNTSNLQNFSTRHHYSLTARISKNPYLLLDYSYGNYFNQRAGISYRLNYNDFDLRTHGGKLASLEFFSQSATAYFATSLSNYSVKAGIQDDYFSYDDCLFRPDKTEVEVDKDNFLNYFLDMQMDTYDEKYFPSKGSHVQIHGTLYTDNGVNIDGGSPSVEASFRAETTWRLNPRLYLLPALSGRFVIGDNIPYIYQNYVGGLYGGYYLPHQLAWETTQYIIVADDYLVAAKMALRYRIKNRLYLMALGEYGKEHHNFKHLYKGDDMWGCALRASYNSVMGPLSFQVHYSGLHKNVGVYVNAGFYF